MDKNEKKEKSAQEWADLFKSIYTRYYSKMCVYASTLLNDEDEAEEIVQRIIMKLWEQRDIFQTIDNLQSYLFRTVKNSCFNQLAHKKIEEKYKSEAWIELKTLELKSLEVDFKEEKEEKIRKAVDELPERCREIVIMSKYNGLKQKEIAEKLNISVKAVESQITRAFSILRKALKN